MIAVHDLEKTTTINADLDSLYDLVSTNPPGVYIVDGTVLTPKQVFNIENLLSLPRIYKISLNTYSKDLFDKLESLVWEDFRTEQNYSNKRLALNYLNLIQKHRPPNQKLLIAREALRRFQRKIEKDKYFQEAIIDFYYSFLDGIDNLIVCGEIQEA